MLHALHSNSTQCNGEAPQVGEDEDLYRDAGQGGHGVGSVRAMEREVGGDQFPVLPSSGYR
jgi:hypothetical protein